MTFSFPPEDRPLNHPVKYGVRNETGSVWKSLSELMLHCSIVVQMMLQKRRINISSEDLSTSRVEYTEGFLNLAGNGATRIKKNVHPCWVLKGLGRYLHFPNRSLFSLSNRM